MPRPGSTSHWELSEAGLWTKVTAYLFFFLNKNLYLNASAEGDIVQVWEVIFSAINKNFEIEVFRMDPNLKNVTLV